MEKYMFQVSIAFPTGGRSLRADAGPNEKTDENDRGNAEFHFPILREVRPKVMPKQES